jgi:HTH-type transcriptional regulator/antitoxin HigA
MTATAIQNGRAVGARYLELVRQFPLRPLHSDGEQQKAMQMYWGLVDKGSPLASDEKDYMETLLVLVKEYEDRHPVDLGPTDPVELLKFLMDQRQMTVGDLGKIIGSQPNASLILRGKRGLSKAHIRKLADFFGVNAGLFL